MQLTIEKASLRNLDELLRLERECFTSESFTKEQIEILLRNADSLGLLARVKGEAAGFIIGATGNYGAVMAGHIYTIDVAVKHRRKGVGLKLLNEVETAFLKRGAENCYLEVRADNYAARRLYEKQGYIEIEALNNYYSSGGHGLRLTKQLKP